MTIKDLLSAAVAHHKAGRLEQAAALYETVLGDAPAQPDALQLSAHIALGRGETGVAIERLARAIDAAPSRPVLHNDLGAALRLAGRLHEAAAHFEQALALDPRYAESWHNLGLTRRALGNLRGAAEGLRRAAGLRENFAPSHNALGVVLMTLDEPAEARAAFARAVELAPDFAEAVSNLGIALHEAGEWQQGMATLRRALSLKPDFAEALFNLGVALQAEGDFDGGIDAWRRALAADPGHRRAGSNLLMARHYDDTVDGDALAAAAREWGRRHGRPPQRFVDWPNRPDRERRLRIGYVSPDFRRHSCAHFLAALLPAHDRAAVEVYAYAELRQADAVTESLRAGVDHWRETRGRSEIEVASQIRADGIDILVDLAGHSANNRLDVFALEPAPVQATWLGYPGTTGLPTIAYRLTDALADPPGSESHASEELVRLPHGFLCYRAPADAPPVSPSPAAAAGGITFGSFNNVLKVGPRVVALWAEMLHGVPRSRLVLKSTWLVQPAVAARFRDAFARHGIGADRLELSAWLPDPAAHLAAYGSVDVALDPFPYHGTTTTLEALWMGVPVITLAGARHSSRVGISLLRHAGLPELIAATEAEYRAKAVALAAEPGRLSGYRDALRGRLAASPVMDAAGFARELEAAYRTMWRSWCVRAG